MKAITKRLIISSICMVLLLMFTNISVSLAEEVSENFAITDLVAVSAGTEKVALKWNSVEGAEGYLVYAQKDGVYGYVGITTDSTFVDESALHDDYNFYWVFPYYTGEKGEKITGKCYQYKYAKGVLGQVTGLKAVSVSSAVRLTWDILENADGYLLYAKRPNGEYEITGITDGDNTYTDTEAVINDYTFYWVLAYGVVEEDVKIQGLANKNYVYGRALDLVKCQHSWAEKTSVAYYLHETRSINACNSCGTVFMTNDDFSNHVDDIHQNDGMFHGGHHSEVLNTVRCYDCGDEYVYRHCSWGSRPCMPSEDFLKIVQKDSNKYYYRSICGCKNTMTLEDEETGLGVIYDSTIQECLNCGIHSTLGY